MEVKRDFKEQKRATSGVELLLACLLSRVTLETHVNVLSPLLLFMNIILLSQDCCKDVREKYSLVPSQEAAQPAPDTLESWSQHS